MLGRAILKFCKDLGIEVIAPSRSELDLGDILAVREFFFASRPDTVIHAAAKVGGISANIGDPVHFLTDNLIIDSNVLTVAYEMGIQNLVYFGSSCMYPMDSSKAFREEQILSGPLEPTNEGYALAKIVGTRTVQYVAETTGLPWRTFVLSNLYGPNDHFEPERSHALAAIIRKVVKARADGSESISMWGDGTPRREFTHVYDVAKFLVQSLTCLSQLPTTMNLGLGIDYSIQYYYEIVMKLLEVDLPILPDTSKPSGIQRKLLDISVARNFGWNPVIDVLTGVSSTLQWYLRSQSLENVHV